MNILEIIVGVALVVITILIAIFAIAIIKNQHGKEMETATKVWVTILLVLDVILFALSIWWFTLI